MAHLFFEHLAFENLAHKCPKTERSFTLNCWKNQMFGFQTLSEIRKKKFAFQTVIFLSEIGMKKFGFKKVFFLSEIGTKKFGFQTVFFV